tara:strand:- start:841 stop:1503 length:663 start_codon:yes stop_codon:yes gene_type:complete
LGHIILKKPLFSVLTLATLISLAILISLAWTYYPNNSWAHSHAANPRNLIMNFHSKLLDVMQNSENLGYGGRYKQLAPHIANAFNLRLMIKIASGRHWKNATEDQKHALVTAFSNVSIGIYATRFDGYSGQSFEILKVKPGIHGSQLVMTRLINPNTDDINLTYVTKETREGWRIIDVILDTGISELAIRRSEYRQILKQGGVAALTTQLIKKADLLGLN